MTIDASFLPPDFSGDVQIFTTVSTVEVQQWVTWKKPRGVSMIYMLCIGGGGGGGGGRTRASGVSGGGGGSGANSGLTNLIINASFVPDILYVSVGAGGLGGSAGAAGAIGITSAISVDATSNTTSMLLRSNANGAGGGAAGVTGTAAAGTAPVIAGLSNMVLAALGIYTTYAGLVGRVGGQSGGSMTNTGGVISNTGLSSVTWPMKSSGGGASISTGDVATLVGELDANGGNSASKSIPNTVPALSGDYDGSSAETNWAPFYCGGAIGGASRDTGVGGNGGWGSIGVGGAGGGAGTTGGRGGDGGDGLVVIISW